MAVTKKLATQADVTFNETLEKLIDALLNYHYSDGSGATINLVDLTELLGEEYDDDNLNYVIELYGSKGWSVELIRDQAESVLVTIS